MGEWLIGVRSAETETDALIRRALAAHVVEGVEAPPNYSVAIAPSTNGKVRGLHMLYASSQMAIRSRVPQRVLKGLFTYLSSHLEQPPGLLSVVAQGALIGDEAILLPRHIRTSLKTVQPRLNRAGIQLIDAPYSFVDVATRELVVPQPGLDIDYSVLEEIDATEPPRSELPAVAPGRYPLRAWAFTYSREEIGPTSPAKGVAATLGLVRAEPEELPSTLEALASVLDGVTPLSVWFSKPEELVAQLKEVV